MRIAVIPDVQAKPDVPLGHLTWAGKYMVEMKPDVIVNIGDFWDMPSLSSYDKGKRSYEGRRYLRDVEAGNLAMDMFMAPILAEQARQRRNKQKLWQPRLVSTMGNHEERINRAMQNDAMLEGVLGYHHLNLDTYGWEVFPYLEVVDVEGVQFCHFFTSGVMGRPVASARAILTKGHQSGVMGHVQKKDIAYSKRLDGSYITAIFASSFYQHEEEYLGPQGNSSWQGIWILNDVHDGMFDELPVSMSYLRKTYDDK